MIVSTMNIHGVACITLGDAEQMSSTGTHARDVKFRMEDGSTFTVTAFSNLPSLVEYPPVPAMLQRQAG